MKLTFDCQDVDGSRWIIRGYKSVIKTLCRLDRQNMSEDNTIKAQHCQELSKLSRQKSATELCSERPTITTYLLTVTCILFLQQNKSRVKLRVRVLSAEPRDYLRYGRPGGTRGEKWQACDVLCPPDFICCLLFPGHALKAGKWIWYLLTSKLWEAFQWLGNQRPPTRTHPRLHISSALPRCLKPLTQLDSALSWKRSKCYRDTNHRFEQRETPPRCGPVGEGRSLIPFLCLC